MKRFVDTASKFSFVLIFGYGAILITAHIVTAIVRVLQ